VSGNVGRVRRRRAGGDVMGVGRRMVFENGVSVSAMLLRCGLQCVLQCELEMGV